MVAKPIDLPWNPSAEQGGHAWVAGVGMEVCEFGCGAFNDGDRSGVPPTTPHAICPLNPVAAAIEFTMDWQTDAIPETEGGHQWKQSFGAIQCSYCGRSIRVFRDQPQEPVPNGFCVNSPVRATRDRIEAAMRSRLASAPR